jgi:hypothetical protein
MVAVETAMPSVATPITTAQQFRDRYRPAQPDMIDADFAAAGAGSLACAISGTNITVALGGAVVQGHRYDLTTTPLTIASAAAGAANIFNSVVLTYDISHTPPIYARNIAGASGGAVTAIPYTNALTGVWDFPLCHYERQPGGTLVNFRDRRAFSDGGGGTLAADDVNGTSGAGWFPVSPRPGQVQRFWPSNDIWFWNGSAWVLQSRGSVPAVVNAVDAANYTTGSTSYVTLTALSATMVAPTNGQMMVTVYARATHPTAGQAAVTGFEVRLTNNAGAVFLAASDNRAAWISTVSNTSGTWRHLVTGLTPGATYYVQLMQRSTNATVATWVQRQLILEPVR